VHFPAAVQFTRTNSSQQETLPGWVRHSRQVNGWGDAEEPAQAWLAHLRRILQDAA
jgi:adenylosuccinate synthase